MGLVEYKTNLSGLYFLFLIRFRLFFLFFCSFVFFSVFFLIFFSLFFFLLILFFRFFSVFFLYFFLRFFFFFFFSVVSDYFWPCPVERRGVVWCGVVCFFLGGGGRGWSQGSARCHNGGRRSEFVSNSCGLVLFLFMFDTAVVFYRNIFAARLGVPEILRVSLFSIPLPLLSAPSVKYRSFVHSFSANGWLHYAVVAVVLYFHPCCVAVDA